MMIQMTPMAPPPVQGGSRVYCPMVDMPAVERGEKPRKSGIRGLSCDWRKPRGRRTLKAYRRHWRRKHWLPFMAETAAMFADEAGQFTGDRPGTGTPWADPSYTGIRRDLAGAFPRQPEHQVLG